jgi:hypothetical protein
LISNIEKFLPVAIFKMATTIPSTHIWNGVEIRQCWICAELWWPFWKWRPVEIFQCQESIQDIIIYPHIKCCWYRTMLNFYHPFFMPNSTLSDIIKIWYVGRSWSPELISNIEKFLPVAIFKMVATIPHKFNIVRFQRHFLCG